MTQVVNVDQTLKPGPVADRGSSATLRIDMNSVDMGVGEHVAQLAINSNDPTQPTTLISVRMNVLGPRIHIDKPELELKSDPAVSLTAANSFHIKNAGHAPLVIKKVERSDSCKLWTTLHIGGLHSADSGTGPWTLQPASEPLEVVVQVHNQDPRASLGQHQGAEAARTGWLTIVSDDSSAPTKFVKVNVNIDSPKLRIEQEGILLERPATATPREIRLFNDGTVPLEVLAVTPSDDCAGWCMVKPTGECSMSRCLACLEHHSVGY